MVGNAQNQSTVKPLGLVILSIYTGINGALFIPIGIGITLASYLSWWVPIFGVLLFVLGVIEVAAAYGLWVLASWSYALTRYLYIIAIPITLKNCFTSNTPAGIIILYLLFVGSFIWVLLYLAKPEIKAFFLPLKNPQSTVCTACGEKTTSASTFCTNCGAKIG